MLDPRYTSLPSSLLRYYRSLPEGTESRVFLVPLLKQTKREHTQNKTQLTVSREEICKCIKDDDDSKKEKKTSGLPMLLPQPANPHMSFSSRVSTVPPCPSSLYLGLVFSVWRNAILVVRVTVAPSSKICISCVIYS